MNLPPFLLPLTPALSPAGGFGPSGEPAGGAAANTLGFSMEPQQQTNWCWAATSKSVSHFFDSSSTWSQCGVAAACLSEECCADPAPCDVVYYLDIALTQTGNLRGTPSPGSLPLADVQAEIDNGCPIGCHISWSGEGGHFVVIHGYDIINGDVDVSDPFYGSQTIPYSSFLASYRGAGAWDYTYLTN